MSVMSVVEVDVTGGIDESDGDNHAVECVVNSRDLYSTSVMNGTIVANEVTVEELLRSPHCW